MQVLGCELRTEYGFVQRSGFLPIALTRSELRSMGPRPEERRKKHGHRLAGKQHHVSGISSDLGAESMVMGSLKRPPASIPWRAQEQCVDRCGKADRADHGSEQGDKVHARDTQKSSRPGDRTSYCRRPPSTSPPHHGIAAVARPAAQPANTPPPPRASPRCVAGCMHACTRPSPSLWPSSRPVSRVCCAT
jgi:hypothetical protein